MLAYEMDGAPLPREHGAPVRVVIPEMYGYKNVKWVERITLVPRRTWATGSSSATTSTPGSGTPTAMAEAATRSPAAAPARPRGRATCKRFTLTERLLHWVHASAFFVLLGSGLVLYLPALSADVGQPPADQGHPLLDRHLVGRRADR